MAILDKRKPLCLKIVKRFGSCSSGKTVKKTGGSQAMKKMFKSAVKWAPVIYPIAWKIIKSRREKKNLKAG
ncbi:hypothetical protein CHCC14814_3895 [Bacillus paralicheniformis]|nr:hypothetical protein CHCC14814_3895 [Bacillus paralicheniformis]